MKITAHGPPSSNKPYVPKIVVLDDGSKNYLSDPQDFDTESLENPVDVPDGHWFSVLEDGSVETFPIEQVSTWSAKKASEIILQVQGPGILGDPLRRLSLLHAAAALVGVPLNDLLMAIRHFEGESESIYEAFVRMKAKKIV